RAGSAAGGGAGDAARDEYVVAREPGARGAKWKARGGVVVASVVVADHHADAHGTDVGVAGVDRWLDVGRRGGVKVRRLALGADLSGGHADVREEAQHV